MYVERSRQEVDDRQCVSGASMVESWKVSAYLYVLVSRASPGAQIQRKLTGQKIETRLSAG